MVNPPPSKLRAPSVLDIQPRARGTLHVRRRSADIPLPIQPFLQPAKHLRNLSLSSPPKGHSYQDRQGARCVSCRPHTLPSTAITSPPHPPSSSSRRRLSNASYQTQEDDDAMLHLSAPLAERNPLESYDVTWVHDDDVAACMVCQSSFGFFFRRHHCRSCGNVVCSHCAKSRRPVYGLLHAHRVCDECVVNGVWTDPRDVRAGLQLKKDAARDELSRVKLELDSVRSRLHELDASPANAPPPGPPLFIIEDTSNAHLVEGRGVASITRRPNAAVIEQIEPTGPLPAVETMPPLAFGTIEIELPAPPQLPLQSSMILLRDHDMLARPSAVARFTTRSSSCTGDCCCIS